MTCHRILFRRGDVLFTVFPIIIVGCYFFVLFVVESGVLRGNPPLLLPPFFIIFSQQDAELSESSEVSYGSLVSRIANLIANLLDFCVLQT